MGAMNCKADNLRPSRRNYWIVFFNQKTALNVSAETAALPEKNSQSTVAAAEEWISRTP